MLVPFSNLPYFFRGQVGLNNDLEEYGFVFFQRETIWIHMGKLLTNFHDFVPGSGPGLGPGPGPS